MRSFGFAALAAITVAALGCSRQNPEFCCSDPTSCGNSGTDVGVTGCTDPDRPLCDDLGVFGPPRTCVADIGGECSTPTDCTNAERPFCVDNRCVQCEDGDPGDVCGNPMPACGTGNLCARCEDFNDCTSDSGGPACFDGQCVACASGGDCRVATAPVCDPVAHECRGCVADSECGTDGVCDRDAGSCVLTGDILYVEAGGTGTDCQPATPCGTITAALLIAGPRRTIKVGMGTYMESLPPVTGGSQIRIHGAGPDLTTIQSAGATTIARVDGGARLTLEAVRLTGANSTPAVTCSGAHLTMRRVVVIDNAGGGARIQTCSMDLVNNVFARNGSASTAFGGLSLIELTAPTVFAHNTVVANSAAVGNVAGVSCSTLAITVDLDASIFHNNASSQVTAEPRCPVRRSILRGVTPVNGNLDMDPMLDGTYHLMAGSPAIDLATGAAVTTYDLDGQARASAGPTDSGADERP